MPTTSRTTLALARALRRDATEAERLLWAHLRDRRLAGLKFRRQVAWRSFILDFLCVHCHLVVEVDGCQHIDPSKRAHDEARTALLERDGLTVLRFYNDDVLARTPLVLEEILATARRDAA